jgi:hypothetical protein
MSSMTDQAHLGAGQLLDRGNGLKQLSAPDLEARSVEVQWQESHSRCITQALHRGGP